MLNSSYSKYIPQVYLMIDLYLLIVSEIAKSNEGIIITLLAETKEKFINVADSLSNPKGTLFQTTEDIVKFGLFKGTEYLGRGEIPVTNDVRWVTVQNETSVNNNKKCNHQCQISSIVNESIRLRVKCCQINNKQHKELLSSPEPKQSFSPLINNQQKKKPLIRISNLMRKTSSNMGKKHHSCVKINRNTPDRRSPYLKRMIYRNFHNKSVDENITNKNFYNTDLYNTTNSMNILKTEFSKHKSDNQVSTCYSFQSPSMNKTVNRMEYKTASEFKKTKTLNYSKVIQNKNILESQIINQSYENNIKNDEMIGLKTTEATILEENAMRAIEDHESALYEEFVLLKNDFNILYDDNYLSGTVMDNMKLETELFIEKVAELQKKYHCAIIEMGIQYNFHIKKINEYNEGIVNLMKINSKLMILSHQYDYSKKIDYNSLNHHQTQLLFINKNEVDFWNRALSKKKENKDSSRNSIKAKTNKEKLIEIMQVIFNHKTKMKPNDKSNHLNGIQKAFLCKIIQDVSRNKIVPINDTVTTTIEQLKNNLKNKMLPLISNDNGNDAKSHIEAMRTSSNTTTNNNSFNVTIMQKQRPKKIENVKINSNQNKVKSKHFSLTKYR